MEKKTDIKIKVIKVSTVLLGLFLVGTMIVPFDAIMNASYGGGWVTAFWSAYNGDVIGTLASIGLSWVTIAGVVAGGLTSPWAVALFL